MDQESHDDQSQHDLHLSRWWTPALVALLAVNMGLVALALGTPAGSTDLAAAGDHVGRNAGRPAPASNSPQTPPPVAPPDTKLEPTSDVVSPAEMPPADSPSVDPPSVAQPDLQPDAAPDFPAPPIAPQELPRNAIPALVLINPPESGGPVNYAVDGEVFALAPGECQRLAGSTLRRIDFDQGDDFGYLQLQLDGGAHQFRVGPSGWSLVPVSGEQARRLIESCRPK
jgi:hypothetical protein